MRIEQITVNRTKRYQLSRWMQRYLIPSIPLYVLLTPALIYIIVFHYIPIYGVQIAFKEFSPAGGIWGSPWVGLKQFSRFFNSSQFWNLIYNTIMINIYQLLTFPIPIILALLLNYCIFSKFKRTVQMVTYAPHFISTVVIVGMMNIFLSPYNGVVNRIMGLFGFQPIHFMVKPEFFKSLFVWSGVWQNAGWNSVIYIASLASINPELHEAAIVDGATKVQRIWHIDIQGILPTAVILFILQMGRIMNLGFQKVYLMQNDAIIGVSEVISTYVYKVGLLQNMFSYSTAIGLFNNIINVILLITANKIAKQLSGNSLF